jgi:DNA polymerase I-like protein with 3'-5' exonuclease and polymerase domains
MAVMVDENRYSYRLDDVCKWRGVRGKDEALLVEAASSLGYGNDYKSYMWDMPAKFVGPYAEADAKATLSLYRDLLPTLHAEDTFAAYQTECRLIPLVLEMRRRGIRIDEELAYGLKELFEQKSNEAMSEITKSLGGPPTTLENIRSPAWLEKVHDIQKIIYPKTPKTGRGSFQGGKTGWMRSHPHWLPKTIDRAKHYADAASKFVDGFIIKHMHNGRLHASINQFRNEDGGTRSHRFSYSDPPLQQMPERDEEIGPLIRSLFLPEEGQIWGAHDYSQQEYRIIVHAGSILGKRRSAEAVRLYHDNPDMDFHNLVVEWTGLDRKRAKDTNFAKAFGAGIKKFALMIEKSEDEARAIYEQYDREFPFVAEAAKTCERLANSRGYIKLIDGARSHFDLWECADRKENYDSSGRYLPPKSKDDAVVQWEGKRLRRAYTHKAFNRFVQGSAARQTKLAMLECWNEGFVPLLQMHDDLNFSHSEESEAIRVATIMKDVVTLDVPMKVDSEFGISWGAARNGASWEDAQRRLGIKA